MILEIFKLFQINLPIDPTLISHLAPSINNPCMYAPSRGGACISSLFFLVTSQAKDILSNGNSFLRAIQMVFRERDSLQN